MPSLVKMCVTCPSTVLGPRKRRSLMPLLDRPSAISASTWRSRPVSWLSALADGDRGPPGKFPDRLPKPALGQRHRVHSASELAQLGTRCVEPRADVSQRLAAAGEQ